jgi:hypothetical protein
MVRKKPEYYRDRRQRIKSNILNYMEHDKGRALRMVSEYNRDDSQIDHGSLFQIRTHCEIWEDKVRELYTELDMAKVRE